MATLCSYELSQCSSINQNKEFIYVKLTDSALRAIEDYQRNQNNLRAPSIQFSGSEGVLSFPSATNGCNQNFSFQIQEIDLQGPQGSFECVQQNSQKHLSTLGTLSYKMRIRANDDVYESTKHKMAKETENSKNKCTREIKMNQTDIGRKVKLKPGANRYSNIPNTSSINQKRDPYLSSSSSLSNSNSNSNNNNSSSNHGSSISALSNNNGNNVPTAASAAATNNLSSNLNNNSHSHHHLNYLSASQQQHNNVSASTPAALLSSSAATTTLSSSSPRSLTAAVAATNNINRSSSPSLTASSLSASSSIGSTNSATTTATGVNNKSSLATNQQQQQNHSSTLSPLVTSNNNHHHLNSSSSLNGSLSSGNSLVPTRQLHTTTNQHTSNRSNQNKRNSEIMKRTIRERLIHLLALRPYKKPELYLKINNDGIREKEKNCIATVLKQISFMRDNTYHLHRHIWNDVQEDWPFYSEQDRQTLKRRKPQNLTPPLSSDGGSSTSGQSPTSTHNGSPPPAVKRPPLKSDSHFDGPVTKKQRISHFKKDLVNHDNIRRGYRDSRDASNMNPRSRELNHEDDMRARYYGSNVTPNAQESEDILSFSVLGSDVANRISVEGELDDHHMHHQHDHDSEREYTDREINGYRENANRISETNDFSDFTRITSVEQRRKYKTEFDNDYQEYRQLHQVIDQVSNKFARLEMELRNEEHNDRRYREIQKQILKEYQDSNSRAYQQQKQRFNYLHQKLSHIKRLVHEFDTSLMNQAQESY